MSNLLVNGIDLYYEQHGKGRTLLMIAGLASDSQSWQPIVEELSQHYHVVLLDNRGSGRTKPLDVEITIEAMADDVIALIKYLNLSSVDIVGHSMGGFIALDCSIRYPEYVSKLILVGTSAFNSTCNNALFSDWVSYLESDMNKKLWFKSIFYWIFTKEFFEDTEVVEFALNFAVEYPYPQTDIAFKNQVKVIKTFNCLKNLPHVKSKTLAIFGEKDLLFSPQESIKILSAIPILKMVTIPSAAHSVHTQQPKAFIRSIEAFLEEV